MIRRASTPDWPRVFLPEPGCYPPACEPRRDERVLHICLRVPGDPQAALANALRSLAIHDGSYVELDWVKAGARLPEQLMSAVALQKPTLIFAQIQTPGILTGGELDLARRYCDPRCVMVQWDGDHRHDHVTGPDRSWFVNLAAGCDINAVVCTRDVEEYAEMGVRGAAYLQIGVDADLWCPTTPDPTAPEVVLLGSYYRHLGYHQRLSVVRELSRSLPGRFAVYGHGWQEVPEAASRPFVQHQDEAPIYSAAKAAISVSIRADLPRYTSDRLLRMLASGAVCLVERFPDCEGLGLRDGENCYLWDTYGGLRYALDPLLDGASRPGMRAAARDLALDHTWQARMHELSAMVEAVRGARQ